MKRAQALRSIFSFVIIIVLLAACAGKPAAPVNCASASDFCVGLVTDAGGTIDDHGLSQMAWEGMTKAQLKLGVHIASIATVDSRDYEKNITAFAKAGYDLIITVGYDQSKATLNAAIKYPQIKFIGVDQPLKPDKSLPDNLTGLSFAEDQLGFLAGVFAAEMTKTKKVGAVCGPDFLGTAWRYCEGFKAGVDYFNNPPTPTPEVTSTPAAKRQPTLGATRDATLEVTPTDDLSFPTDDPSIPTDDPSFPTDDPNADFPTDEPLPTDEEMAHVATARHYNFQAGEATLTPFLAATATPTPTPVPVEASVSYHNDIAFKDSVADPKWDADAAITLITNGADVIFGADSYDENGAVSAAAKHYVYAIGVNIDQYYTLPDAQKMLLTSVIKQVAPGVFNLIRAAQSGRLPFGDISGTVGYAPYHDLSLRVPNAVTRDLEIYQKKLASGEIETGVLWSKP